MDAFRAINQFITDKFGIYPSTMLLSYSAYEGIVAYVKNDRVVNAIKLLRSSTAWDDCSCDVRKAEGRATTAFADWLSKENIEFSTERTLGLAEAKSVIDWMRDNHSLL
jgi:hypothetical protein